MSRPYVPLTSDDSSSNNKTFDIGVVIALAEEFEYFLYYIQSSDLIEAPKPTQFWHGGHSFWTFDLTFRRKDSKRKNVVQVVAFLVGEMGTEYTSIATSMLVTKWNVPFIVNIGVTGSLDKDLKVGSILMPTQITHYTSNTKVKDGENGKEILIGTRAFATSRVVVSQFANFLASSDYKEWQMLCKEKVELPESADLSVNPELHIGHLASGNVVIDSEVYKKELKATDRKLMACEMEAAGFTIAEHFLQTSVRVVSQFISLRCISDMAANKHTAESGINYITVDGKSIQSREWAMRNATILFMFLVDRQVINADINAQLEELDQITKQLKRRMQQTKLRPLQRDNQTAEDLLSNITVLSDVSKLDMDQCLLLCKHLNHTFGSTNMTLTKIRGELKELLKKHPSMQFREKRKKTQDDSRNAKMPKLAVLDDAQQESDEEEDAPQESDEEEDLHQDSDEEEDEKDKGADEKKNYSLNDLQNCVDRLNDFIKQNSSATVPSDVFDSARTALQKTLTNLQTNVKG